jgi:hypothetical protein
MVPLSANRRSHPPYFAVDRVRQMLPVPRMQDLTTKLVDIEDAEDVSGPVNGYF